MERYLATTEQAINGRRQVQTTAVSVQSGSGLPNGEALAEGSPALPERFILLHPFARGQGKSLTGEQIRELCERLIHNPVVLVGRDGQATRNCWPENCVDLLNRTTLAQLIRLIRLAAVVITVDSGPSHLAAALGRPMIAIHTWSDPRLVGPCREDAWAWKNGRLLQFGQLGAIDDAFFCQSQTALRDRDLADIAALATSL